MLNLKITYQNPYNHDVDTHGRLEVTTISKGIAPHRSGVHTINLSEIKQ